MSPFAKLFQILAGELSAANRRRFRSKQNQVHGRRSRRLAFEPLENRQMLSVNSITVNTLSDAAVHTGTSLRDAVSQAITDANRGNSDTITFARCLSGQTINLVQGTLNLVATGTGTITIDGGSQSVYQTTIKGNNTGSVFYVGAGDKAVLTNLGITGGTMSVGVGGGISNYGALTVSHCSISGNSAVSGGGIYNNGTLTVNTSTISGNTSSTGGGGGIFNVGTLNGTGDTLSGNSAEYAGSIWNSGTMSMNSSTISNSNAVWSGGGISNDGTLTLSNSTVQGNKLPSGASGGGLYNYSGATATITGDTFSSNSAGAGGGAIYNNGTLNAGNDTFTANSANVGGAIFNNSVMAIDSVSKNSAVFGGGFYNSSSARLNIVAVDAIFSAM